MGKTKILLIGMLITIGVSVVVLFIHLSGLSLTSLSIFSPEEANVKTSNLKQTNSHAWTKAICDKDNFCQDYLIECKGQNLIKLSPITGAFAKFDDSWQDPRSLEDREKLCE